MTALEPKTLADWQALLRERQLPVLRRTAEEIRRLSGQAESVSSRRVANVVLLDPLMVLKVLDRANTLHRGRFDTEITTVEGALLLLGVTRFFAEFADLGILEDSYADDPARLQAVLKVICRSQHAAYQAHEWAVLQLDVKAEEVYVAALLHDLSELLIRLYAPHLATAVDEAMASRSESFRAAIVELVGFDSRQFRHAVAEVWRFPEMLLEMLEPPGCERQRGRVAMLAVALAHHSVAGWYDAHVQADLSAVAEHLRLPLDDTIPMIHRTAVLAARQWEWYNVLPAAAWLPMLPGPDPVAAKVMEESPLACRAPQPQTMQQTKREMLAQLARMSDWKALVKLVLKGMHQGLGLERALFALYAEPGVLVECARSDDAVGEKRPFRIVLDSPHLFKRLMEKEQAVWRSEANRAQVDRFIPPQMQRLLGDGDFFAMSVFAGGSPLGLFYADRGHPACRLDEQSYKEFKQLCRRAGQGLAHIGVDPAEVRRAGAG